MFGIKQSFVFFYVSSRQVHVVLDRRYMSPLVRGRKFVNNRQPFATNDCFSWTAKTAAQSSNLGTVMGLTWVRGDLPTRNAQCILSFTSTNLR